MTDTVADPLLDYRKSPEFSVVLALYEELHDSFCQEFGSQAAPEYSVDELGQRFPDLLSLAQDPGLLLPSHNGWVYSPEWIAPLRLEERTLNPLPNLEDENSSMLFVLEATHLNHKNCVDIPTIEQRIYERAWTLGLLHFADDILDRSIQKARQTLEDATQEYRRFQEIAAEAPAGKTNAFKEALLVLHLSEKKQRLFRLRLHWLELWNHIEKERKRKVRSRKITRITEIQSAIKPQDVYDAYNSLDFVLKRKRQNVIEQRSKAGMVLEDLEAKFDRTQLGDWLSSQIATLDQEASIHRGQTDDERAALHYELLGVWYENMLYRCGASDRQLESILLKDKRSSRKTLHPRSWHQVVRKIVNNFINNDGQ